MSKVDISQLENETRSGKLRFVYLIAGPEFFLRRSAIEQIERSMRKNDSQLHLQRFESADSSLALKDARTHPMWGESKLLIIQDVQDLNSLQSDEIAAYLVNPSPFSVLLLSGEKMDGRSSLYKLVEKLGIVVECKALYQRQVPEWIRMRLKQHSKQISHQAASFMADWLGSELSELVDAIEKILLFVGEKPHVDIDDIESVLTQTGKKSIFDLTKALGERNAVVACHMLDNLVANHESPVMILSMMVRHWRLLVKAKEAKGLSQEKMAKVLKVHPFFVKDYQQQAHAYSGSELVKGFDMLADGERRLKSSRLPSACTLRHLVCELVSMKGR